MLDGEEGVGAFYTIAIVGTSANALAEATKLVLVGGVPSGREKWVGA